MGIGHALMEELPRYEDGPGNGTFTSQALCHELRLETFARATALPLGILYSTYKIVSTKCLRLSHKEFSDGTARPAFSDDVENDLSESSRIGYQGAVLDVIEADNQTIIYRVLQTFKDVK